MRYGGKNPAQSCMSVRINRSGNTVIALRRRLPPVMYNIHETSAVCQFDHNGYYNSCTMKSCCFAGDNDQVIVFSFPVFSSSQNYHNLQEKKIQYDLPPDLVRFLIIIKLKEISTNIYIFQYILSGSDDFSLYMWKLPQPGTEGLLLFPWNNLNELMFLRVNTNSLG